MIRPFVLMLFFLALMPMASAAPASAPAPAPSTPKGDFKRLSLSGIGIVAQAIDGLTLSLNDGRVVRLAGLDVPGLFADPPSALAIDAKTLLEHTLKSQQIRLYQSKDKAFQTNRFGHAMAQVEDKATGAWAQGVLLLAGLARVSATMPLDNVYKKMLALEGVARAAKIGLWADTTYAVRTPKNVGDDTGTLQIVEGRVRAAATINNTIYLNFGSDWRTDFTIMIASDQRRALAKLGINPLSLAGRTVRIRGLVISRNGPAIEMLTPAQLELP